MKALVKLKPDVGMWLVEKDVPVCGHNEVLIKVLKTAICGTDLHIYNWDAWAQKAVPVPSIIGHEFVGEVVEWGDEVSGFSIGDHVSGECHITCGMCRNCRAGKRHLCRNCIGMGYSERPGCFAEYVTLPVNNVFALPEGIPLEIAAFLDPLGNACHSTLAFDLVGEDVLITGAGPIGCMSAAIARHVGARHIVVTDLSEHRLTIAKKMGASCVVNVSNQKIEDTMKLLGMKEGFDVGLEMSGNNEALQQMIAYMNHGGSIALLGLPSTTSTVYWPDIIFKGLTIKGIYGRQVFETWYKMTSLLRNGLDVSPILTHQFPAEEFEKAFGLMKSGNCGKVVLDWM